jgi:hypothetical protein
MKCSFDSAACSVYQPGLISHRRDFKKIASFPHSNGECHRDHKQNRQLKLNGVLKPNAAGFHVDRLCLTSPSLVSGD